jgi:Cu/Ag efflux pump CusA
MQLFEWHEMAHPILSIAIQMIASYQHSMLDIRDRDIGSYVADAKKAVAANVKFPSGYYATWSGQFESMERAVQKMKVVIPVTLLSIFLLLYLNFRCITETLIVMLSVPFAWVGGIWLMWWLGANAGQRPVGKALPILTYTPRTGRLNRGSRNEFE